MEKFRMADSISPNDAKVNYGWGTALAYYAYVMKNDSLYTESFSKFDTASRSTLDNAYIYSLWVATLMKKASDGGSMDDYRKCVEISDKLLEKEPDSVDGLWNKGFAYFRMGRIEKDFPKYRAELETAFGRAEQLGSQSAAYNLACYYSLIKEKDEAIRWLEKSIIKERSYDQKMGVLDKNRIEKDEDFDNIRKDKRYRQLLDKHYGK